MPSVVNIGKNAMDVRKADTQPAYTGVLIKVEQSDNSIVCFEAGDDSGTVLEIECPWGTQEMANNILSQIEGYVYQPFTATSAVVDPAAEMGDGMYANGVYGGVYQQDISFGRTMFSDVGAPQEEQLDHEYPYTPATERRLQRQTAKSRALFRIQHDNIEAKVAKTGGNEDESFSWKLLSDEFGLFSGNHQVFRCNEGGIFVDGEVRARSGYIGTDANGFAISDRAISNGMDSLDSTANGIYLGTNGVALGGGNFKVTDRGVLYAKSGYIGSGTNVWQIGSQSIYNNLSAVNGATQGVYVGTDGIALYKDNKNYFRLVRSNGRMTLCSGMTSRDDVANTTGMYIGYDGIALGGGNFKVTNTGVLTAKSGYIGNGVNGFTINPTYIANGKSAYNDNKNGVYLGASGIGCGAGKFYVDSMGNLHASSGTFGGTIYASMISFTNSDGTTSTINGSNITSGTITGGSNGQLAGSTVAETNIGSNAVSKAKTSTGVQSSLDNGDAAKDLYDDLVAGRIEATVIKAVTMRTSYLDVRYSGSLYRGASWKSATIDGTTINYLGYTSGD